MNPERPRGTTGPSKATMTNHSGICRTCGLEIGPSRFFCSEECFAWFKNKTVEPQVIALRKWR